MPTTINPVKKQIVKQSLLAGKSIRQALKDAGYAKGAQRGHNNATSNIVVKSCQKEILAEFKASDLTVDKVIKDIELNKRLCLKGKKKDLSTHMRGNELEGKYLKMFGDTNNIAILVNNQGNQFTLSNRLNRLKGQHKSTDKTNEPIKPEGT